MSPKTHRIVSIVGGVLFAIAAALLQAHIGAPMDQALQYALTVLGALGFGVTRPLFGSQPQSGSVEVVAPVLKIADKEKE